jgi:cobalt-zinc-cadmium efflux system outer membrane protein
MKAISSSTGLSETAPPSREAARRAQHELPKLRLIAIVVVAAALSGCTTSTRYDVLRTEFVNTKPSAYYAAEVAAPDTEEDNASVSYTDFFNDVERKIMRSKERWETALAAENDPAALENFEPGNYAAYRELAADPNLDDRLGEGIDLPTLTGLVHELNPAIKAAGTRLRATLEQYPQAAYLDNVLQQYNAFTKQLDTRIGPPRHKQMTAMSFPFPDALALKGKIVDEEVEIARRQHEIAVRDAITTMREAYYRYLFVNEAIDINLENQALLGQMIKVAQQKIRSGESKYNAVIMAQVELAKLSDAIITFEEQRETFIARINTLLNRAPDAVLGPITPVTDTDVAADLDTLYATAVENRQELQQQRLRIARMNTMVELATRMAYPDASLGAGYFEDRMRLSSGSSGAMPAFMPQRELNHAQTPWFGQRDAYIREGEVKVDGMSRMLTSMEDQTRFAVKQEHFGLETANRSIALYRNSLLPQARQSLEASSSAYRSGETDFLTFLDAERTLLKFRLEEQRAFRDLRVHQAKLEQLAGQALARQPFEIEGENE